MTSVRSARLLAIVRFRDPGDVLGALETLAGGGIELLEVTIDTPGALEAVERATRAGRTVGVGTVVTSDQVRRCADAGAPFVVSPGLVREVVDAAHMLGMEAVPGVLTPTELLHAEAAGADAVKLFPAYLGGPAYIRALRGPFPNTAILPTGGIRIDEVASYLEAGATCVGLGSQLVGHTPPRTREDFDRIAARTASALDAAGGRPGEHPS